MDVFEYRKSAGERCRKGKARIGRTVPSRAVNYHENKARTWRRKADRASHHRRRNHVRALQARGVLDADTAPLPSSSKDSVSSRSISHKSVLRDRF